MSGIEEKPVKEEPLLRTFKAFGMTFEEHTNAQRPDRRRARRNAARTRIYIDLIVIAANFIATVLNIILGSWVAIVSILTIIPFMYWLNGDVTTYIENMDIGSVRFVRD